MSSENEMWPVRATAWELAAFSFRHPTHELARAITSGEWFDAACEIGDALGIILPEDFGKGLPSPSSSIEEVDEDSIVFAPRRRACSWAPASLPAAHMKVYGAQKPRA